MRSLDRLPSSVGKRHVAMREPYEDAATHHRCTFHGGPIGVPGRCDYCDAEDLAHAICADPIGPWGSGIEPESSAYRAAYVNAPLGARVDGAS